MSDAVTDVIVVLYVVVSVLYFAEVLAKVVIEILTVGIGVEALTDGNINVSAAVKTAFEFPVSMR